MNDYVSRLNFQKKTTKSKSMHIKILVDTGTLQI